MCAQQQQSDPLTSTMVPLEVTLTTKKCVRFGETQERFLAPLPRTVNPEDLYYTARELKLQKAQDLERHAAKFDRRRHIHQFIQSVLEVQTEQKEYGLTVDAYELFLVACANSKKDRIKAQRIAALEAAEMRRQEESSSSLSSSSASTTSTKKSMRKRLSGSFSKLFTRSVSSRNLVRSLSLRNLSFRKVSTPAC
jgi:hypothetical protein